MAGSSTAETRAARLAGWLIIFGAAAYLAVGFLLGSTRDEEEYRISILTTFLHARALAQGAYPYWVSELGLGQPHPLGQSFTLHPLMPLLAWVNPITWSALFQAMHVAVAVAGTIALGRVLGVSWLVTGTMAATFLLSSPAQNYVLTDFWPSGFFGWSMLPGLLAATIGLLDSREQGTEAFYALTIGLLGGLLLGNGHFGYMLICGLPALAFLVARMRRVVEQWRWWALGGLTALAIASPVIVHLGIETLRFPAGLPRANYEDPLRWNGLWDLFIRPLPIGLQGGSLMDRLVSRGTRVLFFGPPFAVLACVAAAMWRRWHLRADIAAGFVASFVLIVMPGLSRLQVFPATSLFRDPLILFGTALAALALEQLLRRGFRWTGRAVVLAQLLALAVAAWPFVRATLASDGTPRTARVFVDTRPVVRAMQAAVARAPGRIYYSAAVDRQLNSGDFVRDGIWRNSGAYHGLSVINGWFKGISVDELWPSGSLPYGNIGADGALQRSRSTMAALGIRYLLAARDEPVAGGLVPIDRLQTSVGRDLVLYENRDAADAIFVTPESLATEAPLLPDCSHRALLCRDLSAVWEGRLQAPIRLERHPGRLVLRVTAGAIARTVLVAEMYRPGWRQTGGGAPVGEALGGLIAVEVPAGVDRVEIVFRPVGRVLLSVLSGIVLLGSVLGLWFARGRARSPDRAGRGGGGPPGAAEGPEI